MSNDDQQTSRSNESIPALPVSKWLQFGFLIPVALILVGATVYGYAKSQTNSLQPNFAFGFRSADALRSVEAWNAAQRTGFTWMLFGGVTILILCAIALSLGLWKNLNTMPLIWIVLAGAAAYSVVLFLASAHADQSARAATTTAAAQQFSVQDADNSTTASMAGRFLDELDSRA